jgi:SAM-dependent methyltransferase
LGLNYETFRQLADLSTRFRPKARSLMLGRQKLRLGRRNIFGRIRHAAGYRAALKAARLSPNLADYMQPDGYSELAMKMLGFGSVETLDISSFQGTCIVHDMNEPIPIELCGQFDFILDGGTLEHVFHVPLAMANVFKMLRPGGRFIGVNPLNGWPGHGFYQFSPELVFGFWKRGCGCRVHRCLALPVKRAWRPIHLADSQEVGGRNLFGRKLDRRRADLYFEVEKTTDSRMHSKILQSDYVARWSSAPEQDEDGRAPRSRLDT